MKRSGQTTTAGTARQVVNASTTPATEFQEEDPRDVFHEYLHQSRWVGCGDGNMPLIPGTQTPADINDPTHRRTLDQIDPRASIGLVFTGDGLGGVDLDACRDPLTGNIAEWALEIVRRFNTYTEVSGSHTGLKLYAKGAPAPDRWPHKVMRIDGPSIRVPGTSKSKSPAIEAYVTGRQFNVTGLHQGGTPLEIRDCELAWAWLGKKLGEYHRTRHKSDLSESGRNGALTSLGFSLRSQNVSDEDIREALFEQNRKADPEFHPNFADGPLDEREVDKIVRSVLKMPSGQDSPFGSDEFFAQLTATRYGSELKWVEKWGFMVNDGTVWSRDDRRLSFTYVRNICRDIARGTDSKSLKRQFCSNSRYAAVVNVVKSHERVVATAEEFDRDDYKLNTPGGVLDLKTGRMRPHEPDHRFTKITAVSPDPELPTPVWDRFLDRITDGNKELQAYLQRLGGYCLTGSTQEEALAFWYGEGANGKSKLLGVFSGILNSYHTAVHVSVLLSSKYEQHPTGLAGLAGARLVTASEVDEGRSWNEALVKNITGGDEISARYIGQDFFKFKPKFKLVVAGNHKPNLISVDTAWKRRLHLVPFSVTIPEAERDPGLGAKLIFEWAGILHWMVQGCLEWQRHGLNPPAVVREASDEYLEEQDVFGEFIAECLVADPRADTASSHVFAAYEGFCKSRGFRAGHQKLLNAKMQKHGFKHAKREKGRVFCGMRIADAAFDNGYLDRLTFALSRNDNKPSY